MKKIVLVACVATCVMYFTPLSVSAQVTEHDDFFEIDSLEEDDFIEVDSATIGDISEIVTIGEKKAYQMTETELARIKVYTDQGYKIVEQDDEIVILKKNKRYTCINPLFSNEVVIKEAERIEFIDISGCGAAYGVLAEDSGKTAVYDQRGKLLIPETKGKLVDIVINPFKNNEHTTCAYAIFKNRQYYYAVLSNGSKFKLNFDACQFGVMSIFGIKGNSLYCFTPESMDTPAYMFDINDDVQYEEGEVLTEIGLGRYDYMGRKKYSNITPAVLVKKGHEYFVYPGAKKVSIKNESDLENIKLSSSLTAVFSGFPSSSKALVECILENSE